jgi:hypothetical protein
MIGTGGALVTAELAGVMPGVSATAQLASAAGAVGVSVLVVALVASVWLPEPGGEELPE